MSKTENSVYVISSVRGVSELERTEIEQHIRNLRQSGEEVFDPYLDAPQTDTSGLAIILAELNFLVKLSESSDLGRVDIFWNHTSEGSRVDVGMAIALNLRINLVKIFNENESSSPQLVLRLITEICELQEMSNWPPQKRKEISPDLAKTLRYLDEIKNSEQISINWNSLDSEEAEFQRLILGLSLGTMGKRNKNLKIKIRDVDGYVDPDVKSYPNAISALNTLLTTENRF